MQKILSNRLQLAEYKRNVFSANPEKGTSLEQMLDPVYWGHVAASLKRRDIIEVMPDDDAYFAELVVLGSTPAGVKVAVLRFKDLVPVDAEGVEDEASGSAEFHYKWMGNTQKYVIFRKDGSVYKDKIPSKTALADELKAIGITLKQEAA
jgi:hypothetical protein